MENWMLWRRTGNLLGRNLFIFQSLVALVAQPRRATYTPQESPCLSADADEQCSKLIQLTPLSQVWTGFDNPDQNFSDLYTRLLINNRGSRQRDGNKNRDTADPSSPPTVELYSYRDRGPLARLVWGTHYAMNLTAYVGVGSVSERFR